ncbi:AbrB family transcriptional regulator [Nocardia terpenica]|uniref:AbrB family transcriptional regulator n=1 Tax=Nocardia terpenica TaxID=455432 RepID=A0A6G9ZBK6_9NOCA|nr:AbrB family transcriptional regulator [Nocardia terpenica]QIS22810.1 AbrB family transcriptional regulator [Nocardia terpenica]
MVERGSPSRSQVLYWGVLLGGMVGAAELLERVGFPAPHMILAIVVGATLAFTGRLPRPLPRGVSVGTQAMLGVLMGSYLELSLLRSLGLDLLPMLAITAATLLVGVLVAMVFARLARGEPRRVVFGRHLRVALIAVAAPALAVLLEDDDRVLSATEAVPPHWALVGRGDQLAGLSVAIVLCLIGIRCGRALRLPSPALVGPMLVSASLTALGLSHGYAPAHLLKGVLFVLIGFEVGTRFTRSVVLEMARVIPGSTAAIIALSAAVAALAFGLALLVDQRLPDLYLATSPGGIDTALATAEGLRATMPPLASVQSLRLVLMVLAVPVLQCMLVAIPAKSMPE